MGGSFVFRRLSLSIDGHDPRFHQTLDQQIARLRDNGMAIPDEEQARYWLTHASYYRLNA